MRRALAAAAILAAAAPASAHTPTVDPHQFATHIAMCSAVPEGCQPAPRRTVAKVSRSRPRPASTPRRTPAGGGGCTLDVIRRRESGNDYSAVSPSGKYRGAYQFDASTWRSVGGSGDPAAASPEEQDARAAELMRRRGTQPWSVCK